jgi:hypothetical protein
MNALLRSSAIIALAGGAIAFISEAASAQTVIHVDIINGSAYPPNFGDGWGTDAYKFLQDALERAGEIADEENIVHVWVASTCCTLAWHRPWYRPDQRAENEYDPNSPDPYCYPFGDCKREHSFELRNHVEIYGGFPPNPQHYHGVGVPATFVDRDPVAYPTILSGDIGDQPGDADEFCQSVDPDGSNYDAECPQPLYFDNYEDNTQHIVTASAVNRTAVLDGFIIQGGIEIRSAQPLFRDCVIALHEGAAARCIGGSHIMFHRCTFTGMDCNAIIVDEGSRLELLACEPAVTLAEAHITGKARVGSCSILLVVDEAGDT